MDDADRWVIVQLLVAGVLVVWGLSVVLEYLVFWVTRYLRGKP